MNRHNKDRYSTSRRDLRRRYSPNYKKYDEHYREAEDPSYNTKDYRNDYTRYNNERSYDKYKNYYQRSYKRNRWDNSPPHTNIIYKNSSTSKSNTQHEVRPAVSSSNYLSLKSNATPGDRGEESETIHGSRGEINRETTTASGMTTNTRPQVEPAADLREAEGEVNKEAVCKMTSSGESPCNGTQGDEGGDATSGVNEVYYKSYDICMNSISMKCRYGYLSCRDVENYKCLNKISEGTYGTVYRAMDRESGEIVALKHIKYHDMQWKEGFPITYLREISILLELNHPNILRVKEIVTNMKRDKYYMVMEYIEHELKTLLEDKKPDFTLSERKCLLKQLLEGTKYLHDNWVMHRDLKTTNILYNNKGILKICDFGMARRYGNPLKNYTHNVVTHWYRAPELFLGELKYSEKTDIWSIGCIFAEIILGKPLFPGINDNDTLDKIFKLCGSPNIRNWPNFINLPNIINNKFIFNTNYKPNFNTLFKSNIINDLVNSNSYMSNQGLDLLTKMLTLDPNQRISAKDALLHPYLTQVRNYITKI